MQADVLKPLFDLLNTFLCFLQLSDKCIADPQIIFYQWTNTGRIILDCNYSSLSNESQTHFIVHGWTENSFMPAYETIARNYLTMDPNSNVILVDYGTTGNQSYLKAQAIVKTAGTLMGNKIVEMLDNNAVALKKIQIFGHSLGGHVSGTAARLIISKKGDRVARISASEPAGPLFRFPLGLGKLTDNLTKHDADFLDITHTSLIVGTLQAFGTVDTYIGIPGKLQPACQNLEGTWIDLMYCDHNTAKAYFAESIMSCGFHATRSNLLNTTHPNNYIVYGQHMPLNTKGILSLRVNDKSPYAQSPNTYPNC